MRRWGHQDKTILEMQTDPNVKESQGTSLRTEGQNAGKPTTWAKKDSFLSDDVSRNEYIFAGYLFERIKFEGVQNSLL